MELMERKKKKHGGGVYLAVCCCALVVAMVGYANRLSLEEAPEEKATEQAVPSPEAKQVSQKAVVREEPSPTPKNTPKSTPKSEEKEEKEEKITFIPPVDGKVLEEYTGEDLVYNEALKDWRAHSGVDFSAKVGDEVQVSAPGTVSEVFDSSLGHCVVVTHVNGFTTMYANLDEENAVKAGDVLPAGGIVGRVGSTALGDATEEAHLHFEMSDGNSCVNPIDFLE